jgi:cobalt/nickel transport system ATP-binding protein
VIADILAMEPSVLVCDEPTAWLDRKHEHQIMELLNEINNNGTTVIISTHDVDVAYTWADYIFVMNHGSVVGEGIPGQIFYDKKLLEDAELERPWLLKIYDSLENRGVIKSQILPKTMDELLSAFVI